MHSFVAVFNTVPTRVLPSTCPCAFTEYVVIDARRSAHRHNAVVVVDVEHDQRVGEDVRRVRVAEGTVRVLVVVVLAPQLQDPVDDLRLACGADEEEGERERREKESVCVCVCA